MAHLLGASRGILGGSFVLQWAALGILVWTKRVEQSPVFEHLFNAWLPVIAGLASAAATYYFTKEGK